MKFRFAIVASVAMPVAFSCAAADQTPANSASNGDSKTISARQGLTDTAAGAIVQIAAVTQQSTQIVSTIVVAPPTGPTTSDPAKRTSGSTKAVTTKHIANDKIVERSTKRLAGRTQRERVVTAGPRPMSVRTVGRSQTGTAAWYGGRYIGRRTTSGERLDAVHPTAAHRTLPLNSLARVTNLKNGRSIVVRVTDRGPVSDSLLIDMSPRAADELHMKEAGLIPVRVEQVVEVPPDHK
jgi:rare lipoprotein A (peptidoglycan hydrolase)